MLLSALLIWTFNILFYKFPSIIDSVSIDGAALSSLFAEPAPGGLIPCSEYKAKRQQIGTLQSLVLDSDLTVISLIKMENWTAGIFLKLKDLGHK